MSYLVDFLRGSQGKTIRDEHKNIKTYGIGADLSKQAWFDHFKDLIDQGYIAQTEGTYPLIVLNEKSPDVLSGKTKVELRKVTARDEKKPKLVTEVSLPYIQELFDQLRTIRAAFATAEKVPPYVVFSDATLVEMATYLPQLDWEMRKISGVGDLKFQKYGADFVRTIKDYCLKNNLVSRIDLKSPKRADRQRTKRDASGKDTYRISFELFRNGRSITDIARERGIQPSTVENHLARFITTGEIELQELVPLHKVEPIREAVLKFNESGALSPIKEFLGEDYTYAEIRAVISSME
jgi:ATP-dependent DNA helicase RecQ